MSRLSFNLMVFLFFILSACTTPEEETKLIAKGGRVYGGNVAYYASEKSGPIFPMAGVSMYDQRASAPVFETLLAYNEEDQKLVSNLIKDYAFSTDNSYVDLKIRNGVYFHPDPCFNNGFGRLTATDVKFTIDFACSSHHLNRQGHLLTSKIMGAAEFTKDKGCDFKQGVSGVKVLSDSVLRLSLLDSTQTILKILTHQSLSVISRRAYDFYGEKIPEHPIGTGPFIFNQKTKANLLFTRNPKYWKRDSYNNALPFLDTLTIKFKKVGQDIFKSFASQNTDLLSSIPINEINSLFGTLIDAQEGKNILHKVQYKKGLKVNYLEFDCSRPPFNDPNLRRAIYHAVDRQQICREFLYGEGSPAELGILPSVPFFSYTGRTMNPYNMRLAKSHLRKSSYKIGDTISFYVNSIEGSPEDQWCNSLVNHLDKNLNLQLKLVHVSFMDKMNMIEKGEAAMWKTAYISDYPDAESFLMPYYSKNKEVRTLNMNNFSNKEFDNNLDASRGEEDPSKRNEYFNSCVNILNREAPIVPLYFEDLVVVINLRLRGAQVNSFGILDLSRAYLKPIQ